MRQLSCFVIIPSNRNGQPVKVLHDERWGLVEFASGCSGAAAENKDLSLNFDDVYEQIIQNCWRILLLFILPTRNRQN